MFVLEWLPFGGPQAAETFEQFGLSRAALIERVLLLPGHLDLNELSTGDREIVQQVTDNHMAIRALAARLGSDG